MLVQKAEQDQYIPKILIFTTEVISDPAVDMTGLLHKHYPTSTSFIRIRCSSMIRPDFVLLALQEGFDGVFIAADGTDCPFTEKCTSLTGARVEESFQLLKENGINPRRLKMAAICSVCVEPFLKHTFSFSNLLIKLHEEENLTQLV
jgi:coenzyme F420-reducing hydrogenase delta subunit